MFLRYLVLNNHSYLHEFFTYRTLAAPILASLLTGQIQAVTALWGSCLGGDEDVKELFGLLLNGEHIRCPIDEQIVYNQLDDNPEAVWSLLLASGYLKVIQYQQVNEVADYEEPQYELALTNQEVRRMFGGLVRDWFKRTQKDYNGFIKALVARGICAEHIHKYGFAFEGKKVLIG